jgi:hypothetical protein
MCFYLGFTWEKDAASDFPKISRLNLFKEIKILKYSQERKVFFDTVYTKKPCVFITEWPDLKSARVSDSIDHHFYFFGVRISFGTVKPLAKTF